jgi:hypothetical protein
MDEAALRALDWNYLDATRVFMGSSDTGEFLERRDVAIASCGLPVENLNWGFLKRPYGDVAAAAAAVRSYFAGPRLPFQLALRDGDPHPGVRELESDGWRRRVDPTPGMTLAATAPCPPAPARLAVDEVRTPEQLVGFREAAFLGFGYPVKTARMFLNERLLSLPHARLYAGRVEGAVVATSMTIATGAVAGIYWVATVEAQRGRGYGEALTWAAVRGGRELGCRIASLQASKLGRPVYARMGFEHVLDYVHYAPPEAR